MNDRRELTHETETEVVYIDLTRLSTINKLMLTHTAETSSEILRQLADDKSERVRTGVAKHKNSEAHVLVELSHDQNWIVRDAVASNIHCPGEELARLSEDTPLCIPIAVASNPSTPDYILTGMSMSQTWDLRYGVAGNMSAPEDVLVMLANDQCSQIRESVSLNIMAPHIILTKLADDIAANVRTGVAQNLNTPTLTLVSMLCSEPSSIVLSNILSRLRTLEPDDWKKGVTCGLSLDSLLPSAASIGDMLLNSGHTDIYQSIQSAQLDLQIQQSKNSEAYHRHHEIAATPKNNLRM
ncbi:ADP-ribosylation factor GTPase-activating family protein [Aeromonas veronii]|uniref:Uncharacterized protein n=1 Tax=Aeromonas veronii TaxID=654 RepID=A0A4S5CNB5_AERVE|nr:hypothetical protein [Aeromonas veronii]THJ44998.1 hypothetical protein E8Q35_12480 [Aeromonas veronii]